MKKAGEILDESNWEQGTVRFYQSDKAFLDNVPDNIDEELMGLHLEFLFTSNQYDSLCCFFPMGNAIISWLPSILYDL